MCSELLRIPVDWGGVPLLGFGLLPLIWLLGWGAALLWSRARGDGDVDYWGFAQPAAIGAVALVFAPRIAPTGIPIRGYGVMLLIAISTGVAMAVHRARRHGISADTVLALVFWLFVAGIAGARAFFVIEYWEVRFAGQPLLATLQDVLQFTEGGLVVYGAVIGGLIAFLVFSWRHALPIRGMADVLAPCFMAGLAIGRIGCLLNGCCYGGQCDLPWAVTFPQDSPPFMDQLASGQMHGMSIVHDDADGGVSLVVDGAPERIAEINGAEVRSPYDVATVLGAAYAAGKEVDVRLVDGDVVHRSAAAQGRSLPVHPTQVYSAINAGLTSWLLWSWFPYRRRDGEVALLMFTLYPISRFLLEIIRTDEDAIFGTGLSISQNVSLIALVLAAVGWVCLSRLPPGTSLVEQPAPDREGPRTQAASAA